MNSDFKFRNFSGDISSFMSWTISRSKPRKEDTSKLTTLVKNNQRKPFSPESTVRKARQLKPAHQLSVIPQPGQSPHLEMWLNVQEVFSEHIMSFPTDRCWAELRAVLEGSVQGSLAESQVAVMCKWEKKKSVENVNTMDNYYRKNWFDYYSKSEAILTYEYLTNSSRGWKTNYLIQFVPFSISVQNKEERGKPNWILYWKILT